MFHAKNYEIMSKFVIKVICLIEYRGFFFSDTVCF